MKNKTFARHGIFIFLVLIFLVSACAKRQPEPAPEPKPSFENATAAASGPESTAPISPGQPAGGIPAITATTGWPAAFVPEPVYDFGTIVDGKKFIHEFSIENQGESPLRISNIMTGCACAVPEYPRTILPGQKGIIKISIDTNGYGGKEFERVIMVSTNEPNNSMLKLMMHGQISLFADISPKSLILKGQTGEKVQATSIITPYKEYPFSITGVVLDEALKEQVSIDIDREDEKFIVTATNKIKSPGQYLGKMIIKTDSSVKPEIKMFIKGTIR
ncbi:MAG: DUF1573 domain-containing protein [Desulfosalsimonadaceae bacterium]